MTMEVSVTDLKKLAAEMREYKSFRHMPLQEAIEEWADALDAYAGAQESAVCQKHGAIVEAGCRACERTLAAQGPVLPHGWVPLRVEYEPGYPEDVAFGPQIMMDRLKKWLDRYFALRTAPQPAPAPVDPAAFVWSWLMSYCKRNGVPPASQNELFKLCDDLRNALGIDVTETDK